MQILEHGITKKSFNISFKYYYKIHLLILSSTLPYNISLLFLLKHVGHIPEKVNSLFVTIPVLSY